MLYIDIFGRGFEIELRPFLLWKPSARFGSDCMETDHPVTAEFGLPRRLDSSFPEQAQEQQMLQ